ncbi:MAG: ABC transporter substrate-binding protein, partial [Trueperaceae bacterium]
MHLHHALRRTAIALAVALLAGVPALAQADDCAGFDRTIVFAELGYGSADIMTDVARFVLDEGFGCSTTTIPGATLPILQGMIRG